MTTIVAVETPKGVIFGSDSQATLGNQKTTMHQSKVMSRGEYTIAVAGRALLGQALRYAKLPSVQLDDLDEHMAEVFAPALRQIMHDAGLAIDESILIVAIRGQAFLVTGDGFAMRNPLGRYAIGSGSQYALGALQGIGSPTPSDVRRALEVAAQNDIGTSAPFKIETVT